MVGSVVLADVGTINRFGITTGDVLINRSMQLGGFGDWVVANPGYSIVLTFLDATNDPEIVLTSAEQDGNPGGGFIRFSLTPAQLQIANTVFVGARIMVVIDPLGE